MKGSNKMNVTEIAKGTSRWVSEFCRYVNLYSTNHTQTEDFPIQIYELDKANTASELVHRANFIYLTRKYSASDGLAILRYLLSEACAVNAETATDELLEDIAKMEGYGILDEDILLEVRQEIIKEIFSDYGWAMNQLRIWMGDDNCDVTHEMVMAAWPLAKWPHIMESDGSVYIPHALRAELEEIILRQNPTLKGLMEGDDA